MAFRKCSLSAFLAHAKAQLQYAVRNKQCLTFVVGNQSADLDSLSSAILYGYLRSLNPPKTAFTPLYIPLVNLHREDLQVRPELLAVFQHTGIDSQHILTLDDLWNPTPSTRYDLDLQCSFPPETTHWILVDHNKPEGELAEKLVLNVCGVIDHHEDENFVPRITKSEPRIIETSGSCTSLVVRYLTESWATRDSETGKASCDDDIGQNSQSQTAVVQAEIANSMVWDAQLARLGLASILIDTANLSNADKVKLADREAFRFLDAIVSREYSAKKSVWNSTAYFEQISTAKNDIGSVDFLSLLRKDYKQWREGGIAIGISSIPAPTSALIQKAKDYLKDSLQTENKPGQQDEMALKEAIAQFQSKRGVGVYALMTAFTDTEDNRFKRELLIQILESTDQTVGFLRKFEVDNKGMEEFGLEPKTLSTREVGIVIQDLGVLDNAETDQSVKEMRLWDQRYTGKSRKQVAPFLRKIVRGLPKQQ